MNTFKIKTIFLIATAIVAVLSVSLKGEEKKFSAAKGGTIEVKINNGDITLETWSNNEVLIKYDDQDTDGETSDFYDMDDEKGLELTQNGGTISVISRSLFSGSDLTIMIPSEFNVDVKTSAGEIDLKGNLTGKFTCKTSGGDIVIQNINGSVNVTTGGGNITLGYVKGNVQLKTAGGDIKTGDIDGEFTLKTGGGNIMLGKISKILKLKTGGGNIKIIETGGMASLNTGGGNILIDKTNGNLDLFTGGGDIKIKNSLGEVKAKTGSGTIFFGNVMGKITLFTGGGDAVVNLNPAYKGTSEIKTGSGTITLNIPDGLKTTVTAKLNNWGMWGDESDVDALENIYSDFKPTTIDKNDSGDVTVVYNINGGGSNIVLIAGHGNIELKKSKK